jgi:hypothetical protein
MPFSGKGELFIAAWKSRQQFQHPWRHRRNSKSRVTQSRNPFAKLSSKIPFVFHKPLTCGFPFFD